MKFHKTLAALGLLALSVVGALAANTNGVPVFEDTTGAKVVDSGLIVSTSPLTFYVNNSTGNDTNSGLTSGAPLQHIQAAVNKICNAYIFVGETAQPTVQIQTTGINYSENVTLCRYQASASWGFGGPDNYSFPIIRGDVAGDAVNTHVTLAPPSGAPFTAVAVKTPWIIAYMTLQAVNTAEIVDDAGSILYGLGLNYGAASGAGGGHVSIGFKSFWEDLSGAYTISGGAGYHFFVAAGGIAICQGNAVTVSGSPVFTNFILGTSQGQVYASGCTFTGSATGNQYQVDDSVFIQLPASGSLPGVAPVAGTTFNTNMVDTRCLLTAATQAIPNYCQSVQLAATLSGDVTWTLPQANTFRPGTLMTINAGNSLNGHKITVLTVTSPELDIFMDGSGTRLLNINGQSLTLRGGGGNGTNGYWQVISEIQQSLVINSQTPANPTGTTSTTFVMAGVGGTCKINTTYSTRVRVTFSGALTTNTNTDGAAAQIRYGTGSAPANGAAATGTALGATQAVTNIPNSTDSRLFSVTVNVTGLSVATNYWFDLAQEAITGGTAAIQNITCELEEIP